LHAFIFLKRESILEHEIFTYKRIDEILIVKF